jgi:hypothetical protein
VSYRQWRARRTQTNFITEDELFAAIRKGATNKSHGVNEIGTEFYKMNLEIIGPDLLELMNHMFLHQMVSTQLKHGVIICLPKDIGTHTPAGYRPITLLTTEYKLLARIMATTLHLVLQHRLRRTQYCRVPGNTIMDAVMQVRNAIAYSESTATSLWVLSLVIGVYIPSKHNKSKNPYTTKNCIILRFVGWLHCFDLLFQIIIRPL